MAIKKLRLGKRVEYRDSDGYRKLALITGTADTVDEGTGVPVPNENEAHLLVISPTGSQYHRQNVPLGEGPRSFSLI